MTKTFSFTTEQFPGISLLRKSYIQAEQDGFDSSSLRFLVIEASTAARGGGTHADAAVGLSKF